MTNGAILRYRLVVPQKRATLFDMALETGFIDRIANQELCTGSAVRVMTIAAGDLAFGRWMARRAQKLGALFFVAGNADIVLGSLVEHAILLGVDLMTGRTSNIALRVRSPLPVEALAPLMACQANPIALGYPGVGAFASDAKIPVNAFVGRHRQKLPTISQTRLRALFNAARLVDMGFTFTVAINASRRPPIGIGAMPRLTNGQNRIVF